MTEPSPLGLRSKAIIEPTALASTAPVGLSRRARCAKRAFDLVAAAIGLVLLAPVFAVIGWQIRRDSLGLVFYRQVRRGEGQSTFRIFKFRSMYADADERLPEVLHLNIHKLLWGDPRLFKIPDDPRVTPAGAFLRRHSIDELPQLINVLKGEMSLVGPRPLMLVEDRHVPGTALLRSTVKPGMTGPWQVRGRNDVPFAEMLRLDCRYVEHWSFLGDLHLLLQTVPVVIRPQRAC